MKQETIKWQWHQLDHMQTICTWLQTDNHTSTSSLNFAGRILFLTPMSCEWCKIFVWRDALLYAK